VQFSVDDFVTCYGFASAAPTMSPDNKTATFVPAPGLSYGTTYKIKVTTGVQDMAGTALAGDVTQAMGFATALPQSACAGSVVISQIYTESGGNGASYTHDFVELHNRGDAAVDLSGWSVQYAAFNGTTWQATPLSGIIDPGKYYLVQFATGGANGLALPTPDATSTIALPPNSGKLAVVASTTTLSGGCATGPDVRDFVGYGNNPSCFEGGAAAQAPSSTEAIHRKNSGCTDTGQNGSDTELLAPAPRNTAAAAFACNCPIGGSGTANESNTAVELDFCNVQFPPDITIAAGSATPMIFGKVYEAGLTEAMGANAAITAEVGFGPANVNPTTQSGYQYFAATFNVQSGNDDEYMASFTPFAMPGSYRYVYRFSRDGASWTYCDKNGSGSNAGLSFEIHELPVLTINP